ncbi:MAG: hypothetical protein JWO02_2465 [Solirubrobacterales bacterium]|nr:hypothetical protein [Solirubrobacterales bacterium]
MFPNRNQPHTDDLDPVIADELRHLEAALDGAPFADPDLLALVAAVRDDIAPPRDEFRRELDARAAAGFPAGGGARAWIAALRRRLADSPFTLVPALGLAAAALIALVVGIGVLRDGGTTGGGSSLSAVPEQQQGQAAGAAGTKSSADSAAGTSSAAPSSRPSKSQSFDTQGSTPSVAPLTPPIVPPTGPTAPGTPAFGRKVEQTTRLSLTTSAGKLQEVADGVVRVTQAAGGVVEQSSVDSTDRGGTAAFTLSVPSAKADETVKRLSALAHVSSMSQSATDITGSFVSVVDRLSDARAERRALLKALDAAKTPEGIARLRDRIRANRAEIATLKGQLNGLRNRANNTVLSVTLTARGAEAGDKGGAGGGSWTPGDAAGDALRVLEVAAGVLLITLAVALPLGLLLAPALLGARVARRRRREQALDAA